MKNIATLLLLMVIKVAEILFWEGCILSEKIFFLLYGAKHETICYREYFVINGVNTRDKFHYIYVLK